MITKYNIFTYTFVDEYGEIHIESFYERDSADAYNKLSDMYEVAEILDLTIS